MGQLPYVDSVTPNPPGFNLGAKWAFELFAMGWNANLYFNAIFACVTFLWMYRLMVTLSLGRLAATEPRFWRSPRHLLCYLRRSNLFNSTLHDQATAQIHFVVGRTLTLFHAVDCVPRNQVQDGWIMSNQAVSVRSKQEVLSGSEKLLRGMAVVVSLFVMLLFVVTAVRRLRYPYELDQLEGYNFLSALRVFHGLTLYPRPSLEFVPYMYPPVYFYFCAALGRLLGMRIETMRVTSILSTLGCFAAIPRRPSSSSMWRSRCVRFISFSMAWVEALNLRLRLGGGAFASADAGVFAHDGGRDGCSRRAR